MADKTDPSGSSGSSAGSSKSIGSPWPKGTSGNPSGRSKTAMLTQAMKAELAGNPARIRKIANTLITLAEEGDLEAARIVLDRVDGKPVQALEIDHTHTHLSASERLKRIIELQAKVIEDDR